VKLDAGHYQRGTLKGRQPTSAQLCKHGANLIKRLGLSLNQLGGAEKLSCSLSEHILRATESSRLEHVSA
jgi:hypothetical protein